MFKELQTLKLVVGGYISQMEKSLSCRASITRLKHSFISKLESVNKVRGLIKTGD